MTKITKKDSNIWILIFIALIVFFWLLFANPSGEDRTAAEKPKEKGRIYKVSKEWTDENGEKFVKVVELSHVPD